VWSDYVSLVKTLHPNYDSLPLTRAQHRRILPFATAIQCAWAFIFLLVEASGGAGGSSVAAGTRTVLRHTAPPSTEDLCVNYAAC
jgi:hypothetical protein